VAVPLVIVVEDDPGSRKTLARVLRAGGFDSALYESAEAFIDAPPDRSPIGLVLDLHLGGMSGLDLVGHMRALGAQVPAIIITAFDSRRTRDEAERLGCFAYLRKPCDAETILATLRRIADHRED
jgi:FixJ family two-component response regulator